VELGLSLGGSGGHGRWPSAPLGGGTGPQPPGPEVAQSARRVGRPSGAPGLGRGGKEGSETHRSWQIGAVRGGDTVR
jgi:hypothetical protein